MSKRHIGRRRVHDFGIYVFTSLAILGLAAMCSLAFGRNNNSLTSFRVPFRPAYVPAPDPLKDAELGLALNSSFADPTRSSSVKAIMVFPRYIMLVQGGKRIAVLSNHNKYLPGIVQRIRRSSWIEQDGSVVTIASTLIVERGAAITVGGSGISVVRLLAGASIGATSGHLTFTNVHVLSWRDGRQQLRGSSNKPRPSVLAEDNAKMAITHSVFSGLGWDWNGAYGVSWMDGATGSATDSTFEGNFIGLYTGHVSGLVFDGDMFRANYLYGLDPHSGSKKLLITDDISEDNVGHGIIFSDGVTDSTITDCESRDNDENGIMMDAYSVGNTISNNEVYGNAGDGVVLSRSASNRILKNYISHNRIGIHITHGNATSRTVVMANSIEWNEVALQGIEIGPRNAVFSNGGQWEMDALVLIWVGSLMAIAVVATVIFGLSRLPSSGSMRSATGPYNSSNRPISDATAGYYSLGGGRSF